ncbi:MAG: hypothetical protein V1818_02555 [Candidatus Aenigmatarchaeota archaeon]
MTGFDKAMRVSLDSLKFHLRQEDMSRDEICIKTKADMLLDLVKKRKRTVPELCSILDVEERTIRNWIDALEMKNLLKVETSLLGDWFIVGC